MMRMGSGAGFSSDRLGPAIDLAEKAALDWLVFETIGERTLAFGHRDRSLNPERGYNPQLAARMRGVLGHCRTNGTRIMTNMGVAHVEAAAEVIVKVARGARWDEVGIPGYSGARPESGHGVGRDRARAGRGRRERSRLHQFQQR